MFTLLKMSWLKKLLVCIIHSGQWFITVWHLGLVRLYSNQIESFLKKGIYFQFQSIYCFMTNINNKSVPSRPHTFETTTVYLAFFFFFRPFEFAFNLCPWPCSLDQIKALRELPLPAAFQLTLFPLEPCWLFSDHLKRVQRVRKPSELSLSVLTPGHIQTWCTNWSPVHSFCDFWPWFIVPDSWLTLKSSPFASGMQSSRPKRSMF